MGIGFVIVIHLIAIFFLSAAIATIGSVIIYFSSKKEKRRRNVWTVVISPFLGLYTLYFCGLFGSGIVSAVKDVDIGIGDAWYVPLSGNCRLLFIDVPEEAYIEMDGQIIISEVSQMQQKGNQIFGNTADNKYFSYNTKTNELKQELSENDLTTQNSNIKPELIPAFDFYIDKRDNIAGFALIIVGIISLSISIGIIYLARKLIYLVERRLLK